MEKNNWDPLEHDLSGELVSAATRRQIQNILKSYTGWFDPLSELIQNSIDAIERRVEKEGEEDPSIWIEVNLKENRVSVTDNGIGFDESQFRSFLAPSVSFKGEENRGNKGVGATYLAYGFNNLEIGTRRPDFEYLGRLRRGREWVEEGGTRETKPKVNPIDEPTHSPFEKIERGSTFTLKFEGDYVRPSDLSWIGADNAEQWEALLRIKTPLGGIYGKYTDRLSDFECNLKVVDRDGASTEKNVSDCSYLYPHKVITSSEDLEAIREKQRKILQKGGDPGKLPARFQKLNALYKRWDFTDFVDDGAELHGRLDDREEQLAETYKMECYAFFCYSTDIWDHYNDDVLQIRKSNRVLDGGLQLATNSMPQGTQKIIPLQRNIGYQNTSHVVVHFEQADPDLGRKGFQPELEDLGGKVSRILVNQFMDFRDLLKSETGAPPDIVGEKEVHDWISEQEEHEEDNRLEIEREDAFLPVNKPSMTSIPRNEQDTVSLFNQLIAGGVIRGVRMMASSTHKKYDGVCKLVLDEPVENHVYNPVKNPLGVEESNIRKFTSNPKIVEYKYSLDGLVEDFKKEKKHQKEIGLVVAWKMGSKWKERYDVTPLIHRKNTHHRYFHGCTHLANSSMSSDEVFPMIIVGEIIDFLNDPDGVQDYLEDKYMSQITM